MNVMRPKYTGWVSALTVLMLLLAACKKQVLEDFSLESTQASSVSATDAVGEISKNNERIMVPLSVALSSPASKAFQLSLELNVDTVQGLIQEGKLSQTVALEPEYIELPNVIQVPFGASKVSFQAAISLTAIERFYGSQLAFSFRLKDPSKGNLIGEIPAALISLNTLELLEESEIHYLSILHGGGGLLEVQNRKNYTATSGGLTIPLGIQLAGDAGRSFWVSSKVNQDTIATLVAAGRLPENTIALGPGQYTLDSLHQVGSNQSQGEMNLIIPWEVIEDHLDEQIAFSIKFTNSSRHVIDPEKGEVTVLIYPRRVVEIDITNEGAFSVSRDNNDGPDSNEGSLKLIDNDYNSKFLIGDFAGDLQVRLDYQEPQLVGAYTITSGNDAPERDPKEWTLEGSMDGENWERIDQRREESFENRLQTRRFEIAEPQAFKYFRLSVTDNHGNSLLQITELRLIRTP